MANTFERRDLLAARRLEFQSSPQQVAKRARWEATRARLRTAAAAQSRGLIRVDPALQAKIAGFMDQVAPEVSRAFNRHLVPLAQRTYAEWPVDSGFSRAVIGLSFRPVGGGAAFVGQIDDAAPYARFIQRGAVVRRLFANGERVADLMAADLARKVGE